MCKKRGQSLAEYAIVVSLIAVVLAAMGPGFRRSVQQVIKSVADAIGFQSDAEQAAEPDKGFVNFQRTESTTNVFGTETMHAGTYSSTETENTKIESVVYTNGATTD